jgi:hypothetical protein
MQVATSFSFTQWKEQKMESKPLRHNQKLHAIEQTCEKIYRMTWEKMKQRSYRKNYQHRSPSRYQLGRRVLEPQRGSQALLRGALEAGAEFSLHSQNFQLLSWYPDSSAPTHRAAWKSAEARAPRN